MSKNERDTLRDRREKMKETREEMQGGGREGRRENGKVLLALSMHLHTLHEILHIFHRETLYLSLVTSGA